MERPVLDILKEIIDRRFPGTVPIGCSDEDIREIEIRNGIQVRGVMREFLMTYGRVAENFAKGSSFGYPDILEMNDDAVEIMEDYDVPELRKGALVLLTHSGTSFAWIDTAEGHDPPVYFFMEWDPPINGRIFNHLSEFFKEFLETGTFRIPGQQ